MIYKMDMEKKIGLMDHLIMDTIVVEKNISKSLSN